MNEFNNKFFLIKNFSIILKNIFIGYLKFLDINNIKCNLYAGISVLFSKSDTQ